MSKLKNHKTLSDDIRNNINDLSRTCSKISGDISQCDDFNNILRLLLSLLLRGAKKELNSLTGIKDAISLITNILEDKAAHIDSSKCNNLFANMVNAINNLKAERLSEWSGGNPASLGSLVAKRVDLADKEFCRVIDARTFIRLLENDRNPTIINYAETLENLLDNFKEKAYRQNEIERTLGAWSSEEFVYDALNNVIKLNGPLQAKIKKNGNGWTGVNMPIHTYMWVTLPEAVNGYKHNQSTSLNCDPCKLSDTICLEKIICWLGLTHFQTEKPSVICHFYIPELSNGSAVAAVPNILISGLSINLSDFRFIIPKNKTRFPDVAKGIECGITYDLEVATKDPRHGKGLPEWVVFAEYLQLRSVWILLPLQKKPVGCNLSGRNDTQERYYKASIEKGDLGKILGQLSRTI